jgi:hypothetical protein
MELSVLKDSAVQYINTVSQVESAAALKAIIHIHAVQATRKAYQEFDQKRLELKAHCTAYFTESSSLIRRFLSPIYDDIQGVNNSSSQLSNLLNNIYSVAKTYSEQQEGIPAKIERAALSNDIHAALGIANKNSDNLMQQLDSFEILSAGYGSETPRYKRIGDASKRASTGLDTILNSATPNGEVGAKLLGEMLEAANEFLAVSYTAVNASQDFAATTRSAIFDAEQESQSAFAQYHRERVEAIHLASEDGNVSSTYGIIHAAVAAASNTGKSIVPPVVQKSAEFQKK